jgi:O-antigen/teichoic acid export membrane protein
MCPVNVDQEGNAVVSVRRAETPESLPCVDDSPTGELLETLDPMGRVPGAVVGFADRQPLDDSLPTSKSRVKGNLVSLFAAQLASWIVAFALLIMVPRHFGASEYGVLQFAAAFVGYFTLIGFCGTNPFMVKMIARDPSTLGSYVFNATVLKVALGAGLMVIAILTAGLFSYSRVTILVVGIYCIGMVINMVSDNFGAGLQGIQQMGRPAAWGVVQTYVTGGIVIALLLAHRGIVAYAIVIALSGLITLVANGAQLWERVRRSMTIDLRTWKLLLLGGLPFLMSSAVLLIYGTIDIPILQGYAGSAAVGQYALAYTWVSLPASLSFLVVTAIYPALAAEGASVSPAFKRRANRALELVVFIGIPAATGIALVAPDVFSTLRYSASFAAAIPVIRILASHIPLVSIDIVLGTVIFANDRQKQWIIVGVLAAVVNPILNVFAIPFALHTFHNGAIGAAIVTVGTEVLILIGGLWLRPKGVMGWSSGWYILRCVLASVAMVPVILLFGTAPLAGKVILGIVTYGIASVAFRTASFSDMRQLVWHFFPRRGKHFAGIRGAGW